jgi:hypothetical protein
MSEVLKVIETRIADISHKISTDNNIKPYIEELDFLKELLGKLMMSEDVEDESKVMDAGIFADILGAYPRKTPVFIFNSVLGDEEQYRFSRLSSYQFNKERGTLELFYSEGEDHTYGDY